MSQYPIILLHGWGFSSSIWRPMMQALHNAGQQQVFVIDLPGFGAAFHEPCASLDGVLDFIVEQWPGKAVLCGWSLGGMLAVQIAARFPQKTAAVITLGSNLYFTATEQWPGMPAADFQQFCERFAAQPEKTWRRFLQLQTRDDSESATADPCIAKLADFSSIETTTAEKMLDLLGSIDNRSLFATLEIPGLHLLGETDAITPAAVATELATINAGQRVAVLPRASHALPVSRADAVAARIHAFLQAESLS